MAKKKVLDNVKAMPYSTAIAFFIVCAFIGLAAGYIIGIRCS